MKKAWEIWSIFMEQKRVAKILDQLNGSNPKAVGFDIFSQKKINSPRCDY